MIRFKFLWYDFWVGLFWDQKKRVVYFAPLPCFVFRIGRPIPDHWTREKFGVYARKDEFRARHIPMNGWHVSVPSGVSREEIPKVPFDTAHEAMTYVNSNWPLDDEWSSLC